MIKRKKNKHETTLVLGSLRMSKDLRVWIETYREENKLTKSELFRKALELYKEKAK